MVNNVKLHPKSQKFETNLKVYYTFRWKRLRKKSCFKGVISEELLSLLTFFCVDFFILSFFIIFQTSKNMFKRKCNKFSNYLMTVALKVSNLSPLYTSYVASAELPHNTSKVVDLTVTFTLIICIFVTFTAVVLIFRWGSLSFLSSNTSILCLIFSMWIIHFRFIYTGVQYQPISSYDTHLGIL